MDEICSRSAGRVLKPASQSLVRRKSSSTRSPLLAFLGLSLENLESRAIGPDVLACALAGARGLGRPRAAIAIAHSLTHSLTHSLSLSVLHTLLCRFDQCPRIRRQFCVCRYRKRTTKQTSWAISAGNAAPARPRAQNPRRRRMTPAAPVRREAPRPGLVVCFHLTTNPSHPPAAIRAGAQQHVKRERESRDGRSEPGFCRLGRRTGRGRRRRDGRQGLCRVRRVPVGQRPDHVRGVFRLTASVL
jgi:hypothetical protein